MKKNRFSKIGYMLAIAGSSVGLGNMWKFPYITGDNGGGLFVLIFLFSVFTIGISVFLAEVIIGKLGNKNAVSAFESLAPKEKKYWKYGGFIFLSGIIILTFYPIVIAWIFHYIVISVTLSLPASFSQAENSFLKYIEFDIYSQIFYYTLVCFIVAYYISKGIKEGIEKLNNILMPMLFLLLLLMLLYSFQLEGFSKAISFMFKPDFEKFNTSSIIIALGHAFFSLSIGMATILTYSASISKDTNILKASVFVVLTDIATAIASGIIIFSIIFTAGEAPNKGPALVFISLPSIFHHMGTAGIYLAIFFFIALAFAALTSAVSLIEPCVMYLVERKKLSRIKSTLIVNGFCYILGLLALLSNTNIFSSNLTFWNKNLFNWFDFLSSAILLPLGGIVICLFVGFVLNKEPVKNLLLPHIGNKLYIIWINVIKYFAPIAILILMLKEIGVLDF